MVRIRRFNESITSDGKLDWSVINKGGEIYVAKSDLQFLFDTYIRLIRNLDVGNNEDDRRIKEGFLHTFRQLKSMIDDIGGNLKKEIDPYGEEKWDDED